MGTKLKNNRKLTIVLILLSIVIPVFIIMGQYWNWYVNAEVIEENSDHSAVVSEEFLETFLDAGYILYNMENGRDRDPEVVKEILQQNSGRMSPMRGSIRFLITVSRMRMGMTWPRVRRIPSGRWGRIICLPLRLGW